jgi:hypothetical protein
MRHRHRTLLVALIVLAIATANVACRKSNRRAACEEIEAARNALTGPEATQAVATLREHARSRDSFVRTQVVLVARDVGPELGEPIREQCMDLVGEALTDPSGYVHQAAIHGLGVFGTSAERYVDTLLTISNTSHYWNVVFAIESLGRVGIGRSDVGNRLTAAITERYPINPISKDEFPYRFQALLALDSWGDTACPWLAELRIIRNAWHERRLAAPPSPAEEQDGPAVWARDRAQTQFECLTRLIDKLEKQCDTSDSDTDPHDTNM